MNKLLGLFVGAVTLTAVSTAAQAQDDVYISVSGGLGLFEVDDIARDAAQYVADNTGEDTTVTYDTSAFMIRGAIGTEISEKVSVEVGHFRTSELDFTFSNVNGQGTVGLSADGFDVVGKYYITPNDLAVKAGFHKSEATADGGGLKLSESGSGLLIGAELSAGQNSFIGYDYYMDVAGQANVGYLYYGMKF